jgi:CRP-like cAMP-binding protein
MEYYSALASSPLFKSDDMRHLREAISRMEITYETYAEAEVILQEGMVTQDVLLVASGEVLITAQGILLEKLGKSGSFAEALSVSRERSPFTATAKGDCVIAFIPSRELFSSDEFRTNLEGVIARKNTDLERQLAILRQRGTRDRFLAYLSLQAGIHHHKTFLIPLSKKELAETLSVDVGGLCIVIQKLKAEGIIAVEKNQYTLLR